MTVLGGATSLFCWGTIKSSFINVILIAELSHEDESI